MRLLRADKSDVFHEDTLNDYVSHCGNYHHST